MRTQTIIPRAAAAALFLFSIYWLTASGAFHSIDEHAVFAVSRNLAYHGEANESMLFWGSPYLEQARVGLDGELYSKYGIGHSLLVALPLLLGRLIPGASLASSAMLLNGLATATTAFFLILATVQLGYSQQAGVSIGLLFGLTTFAWVYAKTMFSEPLVALGWMILVWLLLAEITWRRALMAGVAMAATVAIRPASAVMALPFALLLWDRRPRVLLGRLAAYALPIACIVAALLAFNWTRFGDPLQFGYSETFDGSLIAGLAGFLFSLDRSIFLFAPILIALLWGFPAFVRRQGSLGYKLLFIAVVNLVIYSFWPVFWGGPVWGPRYLLPVLPLLMLLVAPAVERAWSERGWPRWAIAILATLGLIMQLPAVIWNPLPATQLLGQRHPLWLLRPQKAWLDIAWLHGQPQGLIVAGGAATVALMALLRPRRWLLLTAGFVVLLASVFLLRWLGLSQLGYTHHPAYTAALTYLSPDADDALILNPAPYQSPLDQLLWFLNDPEADEPFYGIYRLPADEELANAQRVESLLAAHSRLWLLVEGIAPGDPASTTEAALMQKAAFVGSEWLQDGYRISGFEAAKPTIASANPETLLGDTVALERWEIAWLPDNPESLQLVLQWRAQTPLTTSLHSFAQAIDAETGSVIAAWDGIPQGGFSPTPAWSPGQTVIERIVLPLPPEGFPAAMRLIAGLYDPATGERLTTSAGADAITLTRWPE